MPIPKWKEITDSPDFQNADLGTKHLIQDKWLKDIRKRDNLDSDTFKQLRKSVEIKMPPKADRVAETPQVETSPVPFDTTMDELIGMPPGTSTFPTQPTTQQPVQKPTADERTGKRAAQVMMKMPGMGAFKSFMEDPSQDV
ncbi:MAG: hypothetical protein GWN17_00185, partial [Candidatus Korarchaeota archaeon]|nr:hypothetical protein [Candidatus Korarchaeota archaeon]